jgi:5-bromo-4-chloroindolyl phosphate hydrolysis protein
MKGPARKKKWNMKGLSSTNYKWPRLKFLERSNSKVKGKRANVIVLNERSYQQKKKKNTYEISKPYHEPNKSYDQC